MASCNVPLPVQTATIPARDDAVRTAVALAGEFATAHCIADDPAARLAIVVEELVCNVMDYAALPADAVIGLRFERVPAGVTLTIADPGPPFDLREAPPPGDLPPERGGGAGLAMVRAWARIERYTRIDGINLLVLQLAD